MWGRQWASVKDSESGEGSSKDIKTGYTCTANDKLKQKNWTYFWTQLWEQLPVEFINLMTI